MTSSLLSLLSALAVARDEILDAIAANQTIRRFVFRLVSTAVVTPEIFEETLACLMTLSEDNLQLGQAIIGDQETRCYDELLKFRETLGPRGVLACGVLHNVFSSLQWLDHSPGKGGACDAILVPSLSRNLKQFPSSGATANGHDAGNHTGCVQTTLEILASIGTDLQNALEKGNHAQPGGGVGGGQEEEWEGIQGDADAMEVDESSGDGNDNEDDKGGSDEEEGSDDDLDLDADMEKVTGPDEPSPENANLDDLPTLRELIQTAVPQLIRLANIHITSDDDIAIQAHAFSALNNIAWTISCLEFANGENANILAVWAPAAKKIWLKTITPVLDADNADLNLATLVTGLAWAISRSLAGNTPSDGTQHRKFISLYQTTKSNNSADEKMGGQGEGDEQDDPFQSLGVKCIGVLGSLARDPAPIKVNRDVGVFLMTLLDYAETPVAEVVEALNQIYDIYGDEDLKCDKEVFWNDGFLRHLEKLVQRLKTIAKGIDKRKAEELRTKTDEAILNLGRFIKYKKKHAPR